MEKASESAAYICDGIKKKSKKLTEESSNQLGIPGEGLLRRIVVNSSGPP